MNISQDGFFLPPPPPPPPTAINGFLQPHQEFYPNPNPNPNPNPSINPAGTNNKRKRNSIRAPDPETELVALSPKSLMATYRFICEVCNKGFQRDQNLQLHRRGHNLPWNLKQRNKDQVKKKVYICPEVACVHHDPSRALGDLTGIKKHFSRKHGEKKWKCDKCSKKYAVMSDWKAHSKICGTRQYKCSCGTIFSRKDSFITHRAFCDALTEERMRITTNIAASSLNPNFGADFINGSLMGAHQSASPGIFSLSASHRHDFLSFEPSSSNGSNNMGADSLINKPRLPIWLDRHHINIPDVMDSNITLTSSSSEAFLASSTANVNLFGAPSPLLKEEEEIKRPRFHQESLISLYSSPPPSSSLAPGSMSAAALLQKAAQMGTTRAYNNSSMLDTAFHYGDVNPHQRHLFMMESSLSGEISSTRIGMRDFLGSLGGGPGESDVGEQGGRKVILQEGVAYNKFATMAGSHDHLQEPHMDLMR